MFLYVSIFCLLHVHNLSIFFASDSKCTSTFYRGLPHDRCLGLILNTYITAIFIYSYIYLYSYNLLIILLGQSICMDYYYCPSFCLSRRHSVINPRHVLYVFLLFSCCGIGNSLLFIVFLLVSYSYYCYYYDSFYVFQYENKYGSENNTLWHFIR